LEILLKTGFILKEEVIKIQHKMKKTRERWSRLVGAVDMDTATLYTIARVKGLHAGALLVIDSSVWSLSREEVWTEQIEESVVKTREEVLQALRHAVDIGFETLVALYEYLKSERAIERLERSRGRPVTG
jgi:purine-nucleoside phosphorylase